MFTSFFPDLFLLFVFCRPHDHPGGACRGSTLWLLSFFLPFFLSLVSICPSLVAMITVSILADLFFLFVSLSFLLALFCSLCLCILYIFLLALYVSLFLSIFCYLFRALSMSFFPTLLINYSTPALPSFHHGLHLRNQGLIAANMKEPPCPTLHPHPGKNVHHVLLLQKGCLL